MTTIANAMRTALLTAIKPAMNGKLKAQLLSAANRGLGETTRRQMWSINRGGK